MTITTLPETIADRALEILQDLDEEWEVLCDLATKKGERGWPRCPERPAEWVAWRGNCCPESPRYFLMCSDCKTVYQKWESWKAAFFCAWCEAPLDGFLNFTPLRKK